MAAQTEGPTGGLPVEQLPDWQLARRQRIVDAALRVLAQQDYDRIQISDVVAEANVARATVYRYFSSKDHLYAVVLRQWSGLERGGPKFPARYTAEQRVRGFIRRVIRAVERQPQFFKVIVALQSSSDPNATAVMTDVANASRERLANYVEALGPDRSEDAATMLWAMINTLIIRALYYGGRMSEVYRIADRFIDWLAEDLR